MSPQNSNSAPRTVFRSANHALSSSHSHTGTQLDEIIELINITHIDGVIASEEEGNLVMHSYAWPGSSGSGVFDMRGRFLGVVRAVDVGVWSYQMPPQLVEDMVWIAPAWDITKREIKEHLRMRGQ